MTHAKKPDLSMSPMVSLRDDYDVHIRIATAYKAMGALHSFWKCNEIEKYSKYLLFLAIPVNLTLWGCKSWALKDSLIDVLYIFLHRSLRRILGITDMKHMIAAIQLLFIGKVFRNSSDQLPTQLLTAWSNNKRRPGLVLFTNRRSIVNSLKLVLPGIVNE